MKETMRQLGLAVAMLGLMTGMAGPARASTLLTYEDVGIPGFVGINPDSQGFHHSFTLDVVDLTGKLSAKGPAFSGNYAVLNNYGDIGTITKTDGGTFDFIDLYVKDWNGSVGGYVQGYNSGRIVDTAYFLAAHNEWVHVIGNFKNIDELRFYTNTTYLIDNVQLGPPTVSTPEPSTIALFCTALPIALRFERKRRRKARTA